MGLLYIGPVRRTLTHSTDTPTKQVQCTVGTWWLAGNVLVDVGE